MMLCKLYKKEFLRIFKSFVFWLTAAGIVLFAYSQGVFPSESSATKPEPGGTSYGMKASNDPALIMPEAAESLFFQYSGNHYTTYPNGFIKNVKLNQADVEKMKAIVTALSANEISRDAEASGETTKTDSIQIDGGNLKENSDGGFQIITPQETESIEFVLNPNLTWEGFRELMAAADDLLGGGSDYSETWISHRFGQIPVPYEEALADYQLTLSFDRITGAHARLFSDYMGIILGLLPVFPAVFLAMRDRKNIVPMLYTRKISSFRFITARFLALVTAVMLPILVMGLLLTGIHGADYGFGNIDVLAYLKYTCFWMLPTAMASTAVGLFFTTLTGTPVAIGVQLLWWFMDTMGGSGAYSFYGIRPFALIPRHNGLGNTQAYMDYLPSLIQNRIFIALLAVILVAMTVFAFSAKRRGLLHVTLYKRGKVQSAV